MQHQRYITKNASTVGQCINSDNGLYTTRSVMDVGRLTMSQMCAGQQKETQNSKQAYTDGTVHSGLGIMILLPQQF